MAKVKKELAGNWELTSGGIFHKSWAGVTFRSRGSAGAYFEGCKFPRPPEQPPPPPPPQPPPVEHVIWRIRIYSDTAASMSSMTIERMTESEYSIHSVEVAQAVGGIGMITVITEILELTLNGAHVKKRVVEEFDGIIIADFALEAIVPEFNMQDIKWGSLIHEQVHEI